MTTLSPVAHLAAANAVAAAGKTLYEMTALSGYSTLHRAINTAGLRELLNAEGPYTLFAPTDAAFEKLAPGFFETLMKSENRAQLVAVIKNHVVSGRFLNKDVSFAKDAQTLDGKSARLSSYVDVAVSGGDTACSNGVIHSIDHVVLPN